MLAVGEEAGRLGGRRSGERVLGGGFPLELGREAGAHPAGDGVGLEKAEVDGRRVRVERLHSGEGERHPALGVAVVVARRFARALPVKGLAPLVLLRQRKALGQPELGPLVAAVLHEREHLGVRHEPVGDLERLQEYAVPRPLVVEVKALARGLCLVPIEADVVDARPERNERGRTRIGAARQRPVVVGRAERVDGEEVFQVRHHQLLVLLLVVQPDLDDLREAVAFGVGAFVQPVQQPRHVLVHGGAKAITSATVGRVR